MPLDLFCQTLEAALIKARHSARILTSAMAQSMSSSSMRSTGGDGFLDPPVGSVTLQNGEEVDFLLESWLTQMEEYHEVGPPTRQPTVDRPHMSSAQMRDYSLHGGWDVVHRLSCSRPTGRRASGIAWRQRLQTWCCSSRMPQTSHRSACSRRCVWCVTHYASFKFHSLHPYCPSLLARQVLTEQMTNAQKFLIMLHVNPTPYYTPSGTRLWIEKRRGINQVS